MFTQDENRIFDVGQKDDDYSYPNKDEYGNFRTSTILTSNLGSYKRETMRFEVAGYTPPEDKRWKAGYDTIKGMLDNHRLLFTEDGTPMEKIYDYDNESVITPLYTLIDPKISGTAESGKSTLNKIIGMGHGFDTVKPTGLVEYLIGICTKENDIVLDSFAGTGTTGHAVLNMCRDGKGNRKFILIEMMDYADSITAERVKRVIGGYGEGKNAVEGTGGNFSFYDLGEQLLIGECLNEAVSIDKIREYIWFMETKAPYVPVDVGNAYYLGKHNDASYYFYYEPQSVTVLDYAFLATITEKTSNTIIYADRCSISDEKLSQMSVVFKKIPRDISRL